MANPEGASKATPKPAAERRAYKRHPITLPAEVVIDGLGPRPCVVRDYCLGGMLLVFNNPDNSNSGAQSVDIRLHSNDQVVIQCGIVLDGRQNRFRFKGRIAHAEGEMAGVTFINPDVNALQSIHQFARQHPVQEYHPAQKNNSDPTGKPRPIANPSSLITGCQRIVLQNGGKLMDEFHDIITASLFETAKETKALELQNALFQTVNKFNSQGFRLKQEFIEEIQNRLLNHDFEAKKPDEEQSGEFTAESLSLVEDKAFDKWLAISSIISRVEADHGELLSHLEKRLSLLFGRKIDKENNPYGPCIFVESLQNMLESLQLEHEILIKCHQIFSKVFYEQVPVIYKGLNDYLISNNVLPVIKREKIHNKSDNPKSDKQTEKVEAEKPVAADEVKQAEPTVTETKPTDVQPKINLPQQDLYTLVGELRSLQQQLRNTPGYQNQSGDNPQMPPAHSHGQALVQLPAYSKPELLEALSDIKFVRHSEKPGETARAGIASQLLSSLQSRHGGDEEKTIGQEEAYVIDVAENVFTSLLSDQTVANSVRPWIEKLGIPVVKMALLDKSLFTDKAHIVRQVINKLADLEILAEAEDDQDQQAIKRAFSWVVDLINNQFDGTTKVFSRAMQQLDMLSRIQQQSYEKNLKLVINEFMEDERRQIESGGQDAQVDDEEIKSDEWLRRVRRLKEGQWILFDTHSDDPKRLKVAWIAERSGKYVFVNVMGRKDRVLMDKQLADLFRTTDAVVLDGVDEPVMDRAQYTMLQNLHKQLLYQASHDEMTGLINRREFEKSIKEAISDAIKNDTRHASCYFDVDKFKVINSTYGYEAGDLLIKEIVNLADKAIAESHILARLGDDEFGLILQEQTLEDAMGMVEEFMITLEEYRFEWNEERIPVTISAGLAMINGQSKDVSTVLQSVESSCQLAKEMGGNRIQLFHAGHSKLARRKEEMLWSTRVDKALDENALFLRCQKIIPVQAQLADADTTHYEILLGIPDEFGGQSSLVEFISAAEQYNRIQDVDRWVIRKAFHWLAEHEDMLKDIASFSINLSGQSLNNDNLIDYIYQLAKESAAPMEKVTFEITETAGISNLSDAADFITTVKGTGCRFSLDDFGAGMSSYAYLKNLPVDYLKIDGAFVRNIVDNPSDFAIVKSICEIAHFMEKSVVAEFVKDTQTLQMIQQIGVDYAQGYGVEKPHLLDDLIK